MGVPPGNSSPGPTINNPAAYSGRSLPSACFLLPVECGSEWGDWDTTGANIIDYPIIRSDLVRPTDGSDSCRDIEDQTIV